MMYGPSYVLLELLKVFEVSSVDEVVYDCGGAVHEGIKVAKPIEVFTVSSP
jgi:hypothetical protein